MIDSLALRDNQEILPPDDPQDEAKRIAKDEIEKDGFDLTERSGRAVKVSSRVKFI